jgi:hypothetical protein
MSGLVAGSLASFIVHRSSFLADAYEVITMFRRFIMGMAMHMRGRPRYGVPMLSAD